MTNLADINGFWGLAALPAGLGHGLAIVAPLVAAALLGWPAARRIVLRLAPLAALPALGLALAGGGEDGLTLPWLLLGSELALDATGRVFLLFTAWLWLIAAWFTGGLLASDHRAHHFLFFFFLTQAGNFGLILAADLISFNLFFTLMGLAAYGLVIHHRDDTALRAGLVYLTLVLLGEVLIFMGLVGLVFTTGGVVAIEAAAAANLSGPFFLFFLLGFGVKAGLLPLHFWLPLAHPAAPIPASSVLSGAMIKAGLLGWLRFLAPPPTDPAGAAGPDWGLLCLLLGLAAAFYGAVMGMTRHEPKTVLAWSSISQMGLITAALGLGLAAPEIYPRALETIKLYALHHGLAKGALFLAVALVAVKTRKDSRGTLNTLSIYPVLLAAAVLLPALSLAGAPFTSGFLAKEQLLATGRVALAASPAAWPLFTPGFWDLLLKLSGIATILLLLRFLELLRQQWRQSAQTAQEPDRAPQTAGKNPVPRRLLLPLMLLVLSGLPLFWSLFMPPETGLLPAAGLAAGGGKILSSLTPLLIALGLFWLLSQRRPARLAHPPPDPLAARLLLAAWNFISNRGQAAATAAMDALRRLPKRLTLSWREPCRRLEEQIGSWPLAGCCCLLLIFLFYFGLER